MTDPRVPIIDLEAQYAPLREEIEAALASVMRTQHFIGGPEVAALEAEIAADCDAAHAIACASGTDAILLALMGVGVGPGDAVVCPAFTFFSVASSITRLGATPIFADIDPRTFNLSAATLAAALELGPRPKAIIAVDLYGRAAPFGELLDIADAIEVPLIEDAAQSLGALDEAGRPVGSRGRVGCFSFFPTKNLGAFGDGGMLTTQDAELAAHLRRLTNHGAIARDDHPVVGINSRLDALQAAVLRVKRPHLPAWNAQRRVNAERYGLLFEKHGLSTGDAPMLLLPDAGPPASSHAFHQYVVRVDARHRDALHAHFAAHGIDTMVYYGRALHLQPCFAGLGGRAGDLPEAERAAAEVLALPVHPELEAAQQERVAAVAARFFDTLPG